MTTRQTKALAALVTEPTQKAAAAKAGISETTMRNYLADPEFQRAYKKEFSDLVTQATRQAQQALSPALSVLLEILQDEEQPASARISACRSIAEYGLRLTEITDVLKTLEEMDG